MTIPTTCALKTYPTSTAIKSLLIWLIAPLAPILFIVAFVAQATSAGSAWGNLHGLVMYALLWGVLGWAMFAALFFLSARVGLDLNLGLFLSGCLAGLFAVLIIETALYHRTPYKSLAAIGLFYGGVICALPHMRFVQNND